MSTDKIKLKELAQNLQETITQFLATENQAAANKLKRTSLNHAKRLSKKFSQTVSKLEKKAKKNSIKSNSNGAIEVVGIGTKKIATKRKTEVKA